MRKKLLKLLAYLKGFFLKKLSTDLLFNKLGYNVILKLIKPLKGLLLLYRTPLFFVDLKKKTINELLKIEFIKLYIDKKAALILFIPKPYSINRKFYIDYRWIN